MTIKGSLETFSMPELFQLIDLGSKSGRLTFRSKSKDLNSSSQEVFEIWFDKGNFITVISSLKQQFFTSKIINKGWIDIKELIQYQLDCPSDTPFGIYLQKAKLLERPQLDLVFQAQISNVIKLFDVDYGYFEFEELNSQGKIPSDNTEFPWQEITGRKIQAKELSLEAMRNLSDWSRYTEDMPTNQSCLQRLVNHCNLQFNSLERHLCDSADGSISLKKISSEMDISIEQVKRTALSMIMAGMLEEVSLASSGVVLSPNIKENQSPKIHTKGKASTRKNKSNKSKASNSLLKNLTNFLKNNF